MKSPLSPTASLNFGLLILRLPLGAYMFMAGFNKVFKTGVTTFVDASARQLPQAVPEALGRGYLHTFPFLELLFGTLIVLGLFTRVAGLLNAFLLTTIIIAQGIPGGAGPFHHASVMLGASLLLALVGGGGFSFDRFLGSAKRGRTSGERR